MNRGKISHAQWKLHAYGRKVLDLEQKSMCFFLIPSMLCEELHLQSDEDGLGPILDKHRSEVSAAAPGVSLCAYADRCRGVFFLNERAAST